MSSSQCPPPHLSEGITNGGKGCGPKANVDSSNTSQCAFCSNPGRSMERCYKFMAAKKEANSSSKNAANAGDDFKSDTEPTPVSHYVSNAALLSSQSEYLTHWNADTGATLSMPPHRHYFHPYQLHRRPIRMANSEVMYSE